MNVLQYALRFIIRLYQIFISPVLGALLGPSAHCRFRPSCSEYARQAIARHGALRGSWLALCRLCRCHPWGRSGDDPVPPPEKPLRGAPSASKMDAPCGHEPTVHGKGLVNRASSFSRLSSLREAHPSLQN